METVETTNYKNYKNATEFSRIIENNLECILNEKQHENFTVSSTENQREENLQIIETEKLPSYLIKILEQLESVKEKINNNRKVMDDLFNDVKNIEKLFLKVIKKEIKNNAKPKKEGRKLSGFALPTMVSDELCIFMGRTKGSLISRTDTTKYLMKYINDNNLQDPLNKRNIIPDERLIELLGEDAKTAIITHFTIQKYINKHFIYTSSK